MALRITYDPLYIKIRDSSELFNRMTSDYHTCSERVRLARATYSVRNPLYIAALAELTLLEKQMERLAISARLDYYTKEYLILLKRGFPKDIIHYILTKFL